MNPEGLQIRLSWGDHVLAEHFLAADRASSFTVGSAPGCTFTMGEVAGPRFEVARAGPGGFELRFAKEMDGELERGRERRDLPELIALGRAVPDGDGGYAMALEGGASARVELGPITLHAAVAARPEPVAVPIGERLDYRSLNIFVVLLALAGAFVVSALNREVEGEDLADDFATHSSVVAKLLVVPPAAARGAVAPGPAEPRPAAEGPRSHAKPAQDHAPEPSARDLARMLTDRIFTHGLPGFSTILGSGPQAGDSVQEAARGLERARPASVTAEVGFSGLGLRGTGTGGGPGDPLGIGALGTRGRGGRGGPGYGNGYGALCPSGKQGCHQSVEPVVASEAVVIGSLDPELVRAVIKQHRDQIRYCYEVQLAQDPRLSGKVAVKFVIASTGSVAASSVAESTVHDPDLEQCVNGRVRSWVFPKPKSGGVVVVTYPFVFTQSGV